VSNVCKSLVERGFDITLNSKKRFPPPRAKLLDGEQEAKIIALRLGKRPEGYNNWSLRLRAEKTVELGIVESISHTTVSTTLKKNKITNRKIQYWVIPPDKNSEFVACMDYEFQ